MPASGPHSDARSGLATVLAIGKIGSGAASSD
jgi:hypothetical protein